MSLIKFCLQFWMADSFHHKRHRCLNNMKGQESRLNIVLQENMTASVQTQLLRNVKKQKQKGMQDLFLGPSFPYSEDGGRGAQNLADLQSIMIDVIYWQQGYFKKLTNSKDKPKCVQEWAPYTQRVFSIEKIRITSSFSPLARLRPGQSEGAPGGEERVTAGSRRHFFGQYLKRERGNWWIIFAIGKMLHIVFSRSRWGV